jgi:large subunit ribosomal protein L29
MASGPNLAATQLRELADEELTAKLRESKEELFNLRFQSATGQLDNNRRLRVVRHEIARIYTVLRERELGIAPAFTPAPEVKETKAPAAKASKAKKAATTESTEDRVVTETESAPKNEQAMPAKDTQDAPKKDEVDA